MRRGVSSGGGQSSLGYLFGSDETPKPAGNQTPVADDTAPPLKPSEASAPVDVSKQTPAGIQENTTNNYFRADGQNCGNFLTDRPSTKVHAAPGGGSSLNYLFGNGGK
ncbi:protein SPIRAL1-like 1 isoform X2 [Phoenix dactylifera]|nr:protein SPIRAL1-like 1 isoform X2 [Phoenix dactylifera]XP_026659394.1 protein SPIRAL1-like 1 isoform X2 [Phoenix dactylifera]